MNLRQLVHPFDLLLVLLLAPAALPVSSVVAAVLWIAILIVLTFVLRRGASERASELSRATLVEPRDEARQPEK